ncbi:hypothetical protein BpHYR1_044397 [Brachionus plicatilis]|uniref:Uncharacterized protein n=1 Tax=Brachionus plicatilis TaxID=10195 RepID=A0A3M7SW82_BRAPC|nr:hypothetical protein BpHYR1_044397 [Brachionus plicatilis]
MALDYICYGKFAFSSIYFYQYKQNHGLIIVLMLTKNCYDRSSPVLLISLPRKTGRVLQLLKFQYDD